jgi:integrase
MDSIGTLEYYTHFKQGSTPSMQIKLIKRSVEALEPKEKEYDVFDNQIKGFLVRVHPTGRKCFYYTYRNTARKRKRIMIGVYGTSKTAEQARDDALNFAAKVSNGIDVQAEKKKEKEQSIIELSQTLEAFLKDHYTSWVLANRKSGQETLDTINTSFKQFLKFPLPEIDHSAIDKWRTQAKNRGLKATTINRKLTALRGAISRAVEWGVITEHPFKKLKDLKIDKKPVARYLTEDETKRLFEALKQRDDELKAARDRGNAHRQQRGYDLMPSLADCTYADRMTPLITLSLKTGLRRGEAFDLEWHHVNFDQTQITLVGDKTKSSQTRHIPLSAQALEALTEWKKQNTIDDKPPQGRVFPADDGGRLNNVRKSWANILKAADITDFRWHDMRHDFASQLVMKGVPLNTVRELCGHASIDTTLRYANLAPDHKTDAIALLG